MTQEKLYIIMPAYNEDMNIEKVIRHWHPIVEKIGPESRIVVIDDGSRDHTWRILQECQIRYPQLLPLHKENGGHGPAVLYGYHFAIQNHADYIFQTDSDGQTRAEEFWKFWNRRSLCGLLVGKRVHRQDGLDRMMVTRILRLVILFIFHVWIEDANTPYRLMKQEELRQVLSMIPSDYPLPNVMMSVIYKKQRRRVLYYPITFLPRQGGKNSINLKKIVKIGWNALSDFRNFSKMWFGGKRA